MAQKKVTESDITKAQFIDESMIDENWDDNNLRIRVHLRNAMNSATVNCVETFEFHYFPIITNISIVPNGDEMMDLIINDKKFTIGDDKDWQASFTNDKYLMLINGAKAGPIYYSLEDGLYVNHEDCKYNWELARKIWSFLNYSVNFEKRE